MKKYLLISLIAILGISLAGCQQPESKTDDSKTKKVVDGFIEPAPSDWLNYSSSVIRYMYYRTQATVHNDITILWKQYPELMENIDLKNGINVEKDEVERLNQHFTLIDANFSMESHDQLKVKTLNDDEVIVRIHGGISYLRKDFGESGGELLMELYLQKKGDQWTVIKTDEYTEAEYKEWLKQQAK
ncbi:hypothetical protein [Bacillus massiliigorillae]|uniref:hypothetical protein n=1 Tax=Bacillus massiliigorillae TaxID=1243664 RepID=UPI00039C63B3|nr:hypothetical protein [Bacillus massiliigorillae]